MQGLDLLQALTVQVHGCRRTLKYLMGVLSGAWVLGAPWVAASLAAGAPAPEERHEVQRDSLGHAGACILGRLQAAERNLLLRGFQARPRLLRCPDGEHMVDEREACFPLACRHSGLSGVSKYRRARDCVFGAQAHLAGNFGNRAEVTVLLKLAGARLLTRLPPSQVLSVGAGAPSSTTVVIWDMDAPVHGAAMHAPNVRLQWLLDSVGRFEVLPFAGYLCR